MSESLEAYVIELSKAQAGEIKDLRFELDAVRSKERDVYGLLEGILDGAVIRESFSGKKYIDIPSVYSDTALYHRIINYAVIPVDKEKEHEAE